MLISMIIATRNRSSNLENCLKSIREVIVPPNAGLECVVVDNGSTDDTEKVAEKFLADLPFPGRYVRNPIPRATPGRNLGIEKSNGDILSFPDDDCIIDPDWAVETAKQYERDPELGVISGRTELYNKEDIPEAIRTSTKPDVLDSIYKIHGFLHGCNSSIRRSVFEKLGKYDERFGPGSPFHSADDTDFVYRAFKAGMRIIYAPEVVVYHNHGRRTFSHGFNLHTRYRIGRGAMYAKHLLVGHWDILKILYVQMRPPLRRWVKGPDRMKFILKYLFNVLLFPYLFIGAIKFVRLHGRER